MEETIQNENLDLTIQDEKTFNRNKWFFSTTGIGRDMLYCLVSTYFLQYVQYGLTLTVAQFTTLSLLIGILGRIWDGINDPMMGAIIDGAKLKWGKFKPWIFIGALIDSILTVVLFNFRFNFTTTQQGWIYVGVICSIYLLWEAAFTMNDIGYWSMIPSLSRTKERRDKLTSMVVFFAGVGTILMTGIVTLFSPGNAVKCYSIASIIACVGVAGGQTITAIFVKEADREESENEKTISFKKMVKTIIGNKQLLWMSLAQLCSSAATGIILGLIYNLYYFEVGYDGNIFYFVVIYAICNTLLQLVYPKLAAKFGRKKIQFVSFIFMAIGFLGLALVGWLDFFPMNIVTICIFALLIFGGNTLFYTAEVINMNNCVEYNEYLTGERDEAVVTTMRPLIVKFGDAIKYLVVTITLTASGLYAITNNVSTLETQKNIFTEKIVNDNKNDDSKYFSDIRAYIDDANMVEILSYTVSNEEIAKTKVEESTVLSKCQYDYKYASVINSMYLVKKDSSGNVVDAKMIKEINSDYVDENYRYTLEITIKDQNGNVLNAADKIFKEAKEGENSLKIRLILRFFSTILPAILFYFCMIIQRKKFIIDEEYYDNLLIENKKKVLEKQQ